MSAVDNIQVAIRVRPLIKNEKDKNLAVQWNVQNNNIYQIDESGQRNGELYSFDHIFEMSKSNSEIYENIVKTFVDSALDGLNSTIFAYGQTSSGKTYTMLGNDKDKGLVPLAIEDIFDSIEKNQSRKFLLKVSYVEIYNEKINDLLDPSTKHIKIRELFSGMIQLQDVKEEVVSSKKQVYDLLKDGTLNRHIGATNMNERSSRSHTIFKIVIESAKVRDCSDEDSPVQISSLNLVDLAGSERVAQTKATGVRLKEGSHINKSLSNLGLVIRQLSDGQEYVNFRDSKLTRLLQCSLGGNAKTLIIATITPTSVEDTNSTLAFAQRAKAVKNKPQINEILPDSASSEKYAQMNAQLKQRLKNQLLVNKNLERTKEENMKEILRLQEQMRLLETFWHSCVPNTTKTVPKRRHTICFLGQKKPLMSVKEEPEEDMQILEERFHVTAEFATPMKSEFTQNTNFDNSVSVTPLSNLRLRYQALEQDHKELINFTRYEQDILKEMSERTEELETRLEYYIKNYSEMKANRKIEEEILKTQLKNKFKIREEELVERIALLEKELKEKEEKDEEKIPDISSEFKYVQDQLEVVREILESLLFVDNQYKNIAYNYVYDSSVQEIIESFNTKTKTAKEMIINEIWKQINCFGQASEQLNSSLLILPNELESFNYLLEELSNFKNELPSQLTNSNVVDVENIKILHIIYESLLKKNDLIGRFSEKIIGLQDQVKGHSEAHNTQLEVILNLERDVRLYQEQVEQLTNLSHKNEAELNTYKEMVHKFNEKTTLEKTATQFTQTVDDYDTRKYEDIARKVREESDANIRDFKEEIDRLNSIVEANKSTVDLYVAKSAQDEQLLLNAQLKIGLLEERVRELELFEENCDIKKYQAELEEVYRTLEESKKVNKTFAEELETIQNMHQAEIEQYAKKLEDREKNLEQLQDEMNSLNLGKINLERNVEKLEGVLCSILEQFIKDEKAVLAIKLSQEERDIFKNIRRDIRDVNVSLRAHLQCMQDHKDYNLDRINKLLLKSSENLKQYFTSEKTFLESRINNLDQTTKEYLQEISVLKELSKNGCPDCEPLKNEVSDLKNQISSKETHLTETLSKLCDLQEKLLATSRQEQSNLNKTCFSCAELQKKYSHLNKKYEETMCELVDLRFNRLAVTNKESKSHVLELYIKNDKEQKMQLKRYKAAATAGKNSIEIQCDMDKEGNLLKKYNQMKQICIMRKQEIEELKKKCHLFMDN